MTKGIQSPETYYYRGVYVDCVRALDFAASRPEVDPERDRNHRRKSGRWHQPGGRESAGPSPRTCDCRRFPTSATYRRALEVTDRDPYPEIALYCHAAREREEQAFKTLSYFDNLDLADKIRLPVLASVGLQDLITPPSTIFAAYNRYPAEKEIGVYPYGGHESFPTHHIHKLAWAKRLLRS